MRMPDVSAPARPARGTAAWWRDIANHVEDIAIDLAELHVDDPLTTQQVMRVDALLRELAGIARERGE
jgi:hypothetical protein